MSKNHSQIIGRLIPTLWEDEHFIAVCKPPRVNLESAIRKRGMSIIQLIAQIHAPRAGEHSENENPKPLPLILPERFASGLALFAKSEEAQRRFAGMAMTNKLRFVHAAMAKGNSGQETRTARILARLSDSG